MEAKMEPHELKDNGEHRPSLESCVASDVIYDDSPICPCIGSEHQAEIPNLATEDERCQLMTSSLESCMVLDYDYTATIGLAIPIMWAPPSEVNKEEELQKRHPSEGEEKASSQDEDSQVTSVCPTSHKTSDCDSTYQDPHPVVPEDHIEFCGSKARDEKLTPCSTQEGINLTNKPMMQHGKIEQFTPMPDSSTPVWSGMEAECFLLGLYIFGKNLSLLSRFLGSKTVGDTLSYYYGKFYKRDAYKRWSDCRKARTRRCILGERIFTGWRQQELISRLKSKILKEAHDSLVEIFKSFSDGQTSLEDFVFALKSTVGTEAFVAAVGIGKGKHDLTGFVLDPSKPNQVLSVHPDMPTGKDCSSLASEDIIKFLTGDFRRSKTRSNDLFWEAVWPRLLARGWHSEQPKDVSTTKNCLVFLAPGIKKFSRSKLTKGTHYFDSISDVLKRVAADPILLELEIDGMDNGVTSEKNGCATDMKLNQDGPLDGYRELPKFTIIDTSLVEGEEPFKVRELRKLPADANIRFSPSHHLNNILSASSSEEQDADDRSSDEKEDCRRVTADVNEIEMVSAYNAGIENQVDSLQNVVTEPCSAFPDNGHSSIDSGNIIGSTSLFGLKTKAERRKYLSPVSKRRRLSGCSNDTTSRRSFPFSKGDGLEKEKMKPLSYSSKQPVVDVGGTFQMKTIACCSTKERPCKQIMDASNSLSNDQSNEKVNVANLNEDKSFECKVVAVAEVHSKVAETKTAKEGAQVGSLVSQNKLETPPDDNTSTSVSITSSDNHGCMTAEEAPSISNSEKVHDVLEATGGPGKSQSDLALQTNSRRHGTRNRPPTAKALEAVAFGLLGGGKRKGEPKSPGTSRPPQRACKSTKDSFSSSTSSDTEKSSMETEAQR